LVEEYGPVILEEFCGGFELEEFDFISGTRDEQLRLHTQFQGTRSPNTTSYMAF
jgi:hypothetical protein